jgi:hypothetical protein
MLIGLPSFIIIRRPFRSPLSLDDGTHYTTAPALPQIILIRDSRLPVRVIESLLHNSMVWKMRIVSQAELKPYLRDGGQDHLLTQVDALIKQQKATWPQLQEGYEGLTWVLLKRIALGDFYVWAQYNPRRIKSTAAATDRVSIQQRPCFLCAENLPPEEKGLAYGENLVILCNPFPIVDHHLSIVHRRHIEQTILGHFETMLDLAFDLSRDYFVLYNGPKCGASAPDHLHFQAGRISRPDSLIHPRLPEGLPIVDHRKTIEGQRHKSVIINTTGLEVFSPRNYHVKVLIARGQNRERLADWFYQTLAVLAEATGTDREPMINLIVTHDGQAWTAYLFPRSKHRPACYFAEGEARLTVSPAAIDLAGWLVVPIEEHFQKINSEVVKQIFSEVTLADGPFGQVAGKLKKL